MAAGHSYGELAALCLAGVMREADLLALSAARGEAIVAAAGADPGTMAAVAADPRRSPRSSRAARASSSRTGTRRRSACCRARPPRSTWRSSLVGEAGLTAKRIPVACAFHSSIVAGAKDALARTLAAMPIAAAEVPGVLEHDRRRVSEPTPTTYARCSPSRSRSRCGSRRRSRRCTRPARACSSRPARARC